MSTSVWYGSGVRCEDSHSVLDDCAGLLASVGNHLPRDTKSHLVIMVLHKTGQAHLGSICEK
jgi:hypothetical protein